MYRMILIAGLLLFVAALQGHSPQEMELLFDSENQVLTVYIQHNVGEPEEHYVERVEIQNEGEEILIQQLSRQDDENGVSLRYRIPDALGGSMNLSVTAHCVRIGSLTGEIEIE